MSLLRKAVPVLLVLLLAVASLTVAAVTPAHRAPAAPAATSGPGSYPPMAPGPATVLPDFVGAPVAARPLPSAGVPQNPHLGPIPYSYVHDDSWNSDTANVRAPLGSDPQTFSSTLGMPDVLVADGSGGGMAFDRHGRVIYAFGAVGVSSMLLLDPASLEVLCSYPMESMNSSGLGNAYFFVDEHDRIVTGLGSDEIVTLREGGTVQAPTLEPVPARHYDLSAVVPADDHLAGLLPDWQGRIWFQTAGMGAEAGPRVGVIDPATWPEVEWAQLPQGEQISNGLAVTRTGSFVLTSSALYKFKVGHGGRPYRVWRAGYDHSVDKSRLGQLSLGSGTSPTVLGGGSYVAINDSGEHMNVLVFRTADRLQRGQRRLLGAFPTFEDAAGQADADSLLGYRRSIIAENNYGYSWIFDPQTGVLSSQANLPGLERIDVTRDGRLVKVWENDEVVSNTLPKLSTRTGLLYVIARQRDEQNGVDAYYWTAIDFRTGEVVWQKLAGTGVNYDGYWPGPDMGKDGTMYMAVYGGVVAIRDRD